MLQHRSPRPRRRHMTNAQKCFYSPTDNRSVPPWIPNKHAATVFVAVHGPFYGSMRFTIFFTIETKKNHNHCLVLTLTSCWCGARSLKWINQTQQESNLKNSAHTLSIRLICKMYFPSTITITHVVQQRTKINVDQIYSKSNKQTNLLVARVYHNGREKKSWNEWQSNKKWGTSCIYYFIWYNK